MIFEQGENYAVCFDSYYYYNLARHTFVIRKNKNIQQASKRLDLELYMALSIHHLRERKSNGKNDKFSLIEKHLLVGLEERWCLCVL